MAVETMVLLVAVVLVVEAVAGAEEARVDQEVKAITVELRAE